MSEKIDRELTEEAVLAFISRKKGIRHECNKIARAFKVKPGLVLPILSKLEQEKKITKTTFMSPSTYYIPTDEEIALLKHVQRVPVFKPMHGYEARIQQFREMAEKTR